MVIAACLALGAASPGFACAIPSELIIQQQMLNFKNPNATHVMGATWTLQKAGKLDMPDPERIMARGAKRKEMDEAARLAALRAITESRPGVLNELHLFTPCHFTNRAIIPTP